VREHEPRLHLDGGEDGLQSIQHLAATAPDYLRSGGPLASGNESRSRGRAQMLENQGNYRQIQIINDLAGFDRLLSPANLAPVPAASASPAARDTHLAIVHLTGFRGGKDTEAGSRAAS
jgi:hypothetical protein